LEQFRGQKWPKKHQKQRYYICFLTILGLKKPKKGWKTNKKVCFCSFLTDFLTKNEGFCIKKARKRATKRLVGVDLVLNFASFVSRKPVASQTMNGQTFVKTRISLLRDEASHLSSYVCIG